jgi:hypothetical protein
MNQSAGSSGRHQTHLLPPLFSRSILIITQHEDHREPTRVILIRNFLQRGVGHEPQALSAYPQPHKSQPPARRIYLPRLPSCANNGGRRGRLGGGMMKGFVKALIYGQYGPSLTSVMSLASWWLFALVSLYLVLTDRAWVHYDTFAVLTLGGGLGGQLGGKWINNRFSPVASYPGAPQHTQQQNLPFGSIGGQGR